ncbi:hypothetical protein BKA69DRAFT_1125048 [Paraphysoderma sedebokerense]|nr:hypothetical protein BKA69DRAFT_1125048 [Paraphysoderma sedebokerense]
MDFPDEDLNDPALLKELAALQRSTAPKAQQPNATVAVPDATESSSPPTQTSTKKNEPLQTSPEFEQYYQTVSGRLQQYRQAAVFYKRQNNLNEAKEMLKVVKELQQALSKLDFVKEGVSSLEEAKADIKLPPPPPALATEYNPAASKQTNATPVASATVAKGKASPAVKQKANVSTSVEIKTNLSEPTNQFSTVADLETQLESQIKSCTSISAHYLSKGLKKEAVEYHKHKKTFTSDLATLRSYKDAQLRLGKSIEEIPLPQFHFQTFSFQIENVYLDIPMTEMHVHITKAYGLSSKEVQAADIDSFVVWDLGFDGDTGKGETQIVKKSINPEYGYKETVKIERNRTLQRHLERKKATFEVFHKSAGILGFGILAKNVTLGRAILKLDPLLNKSEIHEVVELTDSNRRSNGAKLEIQIRLRQPILKPDIQNMSERWLVLAETSPTSSIEPPVSPKIANATPAKGVEKNTKPPVLPEKPSTTKPVSSPQTPSPSPSPTNAPNTVSPSQTSPTESVPELEEAEDYIESTDTIVSNLVLENEIAAITSQITKFQSQKKPPPEDLMDKKQALELKLNLLVLQVQMGTLTMDAYSKTLQNAITQTKKHALTCKKFGKLELAKKALARIQLMQKEVEEINQMLQGEA